MAGDYKINHLWRKLGTVCELSFCTSCFSDMPRGESFFTVQATLRRISRPNDTYFLRTELNNVLGDEIVELILLTRFTKKLFHLRLGTSLQTQKNQEAEKFHAWLKPLTGTLAQKR